ncbi:MAG: transpeptidase family protein [Deltaproteobacteria bacterium]|nr:transpeptidase family protein [Deltaproteobacteria bacterium]
MTGKDRKWFRFRIATVLVFFVVLCVALVSRAFQLQVLQGDFLKTRADRQQSMSITLPPERGLILDQNGEKLAATVLADSVYADPLHVADASRTAESLSSFLNLEKEEIAAKLSGSGRFCWIKRKVTPAEAEGIRSLKLEGVHLLQEPDRYYPQKDLACHLIGFVDIDSEGREGIELKYNDKLLGTPRKASWLRDARGARMYLNEESVADTENGNCNLILTIDGQIQYIAELQLQQAVEKNEARAGCAIVMDPRTGEILAMANYPHFNPNAVSRCGPDARRNRAVTDCFDPGSVFKPFVVAAAIEEGVAGETDVFDCENGAYYVGGRTIHEAQMKKHDKLTLGEVLKYSSNIGIAKVSERLGKEKFYEYITRFGFGSRTGIDVPGEVSGILRRPERWRDIDFATMSFGQGISVTAIQLVTAYAAIANHGVLMKPHVVRGIVDSQGRVIEEYAPEMVRRVISPVTAERVTTLLTNVVEEEDGTGARARVSGVSVAGKTGTSQKFDRETGQYSRRKVMTSFMGFFPAEAPRMVICVVLDEPRHNRWGGVAAAPVFRNISEQILRCIDRDIEIRKVEAAAENEEFNILNAAAVPAVPAVSTLVEVNGSVIPDFRGMSMREVVRLTRRLGIELKISGSGWAVAQKPEPGTAIEPATSCLVAFDDGF